MEILKRSIPEKVFLLLVCIAALLIPFHISLTSPPLILSAFVVLLPFGYNYKWQLLSSNRRYLFFASLYLLFLFAYFISSNKTEALHDLKIKLYILLIPLIWAACRPFSKKEIHLLLWCFVFSCIAFALFGLSRATYDLIINGENNFYYKELVSFTVIHPSYIGMFQAFASIIIVLDMILNWKYYSGFKKLLFVAAVILLMMFIFLLTAKMAIVSLFIFLNIAFFIWGAKIIRRKKSIVLLLAGNVFALIILLALPYTRIRMELLFTYDDVSYVNSVNSREEIWQSSLEVAKEHLLFGTGSGDAEEELVAAYKTNGFIKGVQERYNAHNQYLQVLVETGIVGLIFFTGFLCLCIRLAIRSKNYLYLGFLLLFMVNIFTESMLMSQSGVVFFVFFNTLLGLNSEPKV